MVFRKYRSESDFRAIGGIPPSRPDSRAQGMQMSALRQANSRASIAVGGNHHSNPHSYMPNGKHYGHRSHSEADLLASGNDVYDYGGGGGGENTRGESRLYSSSRNHRQQHQHLSDHPNGHIGNSYGVSHRKRSEIGLVYPNIQVHCLDVNPCLRGVSLQSKAGDLFAIMATSQKEGTALTECLAGLRERMGGEILINGQQMSRRGLRELSSYVPALNASSLDPRMSVQCTLNFHATLRGPMDRTDLKERVSQTMPCIC